MNRLFLSSVLTLALILAGCGDQITQVTAKEPATATITVAASGEARAAPDRFLIRAVSSREGDDIEAMQSSVNQEVRAALDLARDLGLEDDQIQATRLTIQPRWQYHPTRELVGHRVARDIHIRVSGLETYARLLEGLPRLGFTEVHQTGSELSEPDALEDQALTKAMDNARRKAETLAASAGLPLGSVLTIQEQGSERHQPVPMMMARSAEDAGPEASYSAGEISLSRQLSVTFRLETGDQ